MTALVALECGYAFQTLVAAIRLERADLDEHDVEPDAPEPGGDPGPMPTPTEHEETHVSDEYTPTVEEAGETYGIGWFADDERPNRGTDPISEWVRFVESVRTAERERIAKAIEGLPTTWPNGVKHSAAWMRLEAADVARQGADA
ncbi:hypothetical protein G8C93_00905 [Cellulosimicrobium cellulans]|uniref:hypothetical protein n=1 Tax=Cellulosimicrobium cellulans TaxID=1710 RepID=UPI001883519A|nr:hypothetical protein [Cellulosimicrobium cellulans]MBE9924451.1 hypothetical protein [Cellulosimicrobium cellulans]